MRTNRTKKLPKCMGTISYFMIRGEMQEWCVGGVRAGPRAAGRGCEVGVCDARARWSCGVVWAGPRTCSPRISKVGKCAAFQLWTPSKYIINSECQLHFIADEYCDS